MLCPFKSDRPDLYGERTACCHPSVTSLNYTGELSCIRIIVKFNHPVTYSLTRLLKCPIVTNTPLYVESVDHNYLQFDHCSIFC